MAGIRNLLNDTVIIKKANGDNFTCNKAKVGKNRVHIHCGEIPLEEKDIIIHKIGDNNIQEFVVTNRGFYDDPHFGRHYQADVVPKSMYTENTMENITIDGDNNKVLVNSTDNSINYNEIPFDKLYDEINKIDDEKIKSEAIKCLDELKTATNNESLTNKCAKLIGIVSGSASTASALIKILSSSGLL